MSSLRAGLLALVLGLLGCGGTETGNPGQTTASVALAVHSTSPDVHVGPGMVGVHVESAWLKVSSISRSDCAAQEPHAISDGFVSDLVAGSDEVSDLDLGQEPLCTLELSLSPDAPPPSGAPPELELSSLVVTGTRDDGAPFVISTPASLPIILYAPEPIDATSYQALVLGFDLGTWFNGTDLNTVVLDDQGVARLDGSAHPSSVAAFEAQVPPGSALYADLDGDGALDADEVAHPLAVH